LEGYSGFQKKKTEQKSYIQALELYVDKKISNSEKIEKLRN